MLRGKELGDFCLQQLHSLGKDGGFVLLSLEARLGGGQFFFNGDDGPIREFLLKGSRGKSRGAAAQCLMASWGGCSGRRSFNLLRRWLLVKEGK